MPSPSASSILMPRFTLPKTTCLPPAVQPWQCKWTSENKLKWGQHLPWTGYQELHARGHSPYYQRSPSRATWPPAPWWCVESPNRHINVGIFCESGNPYNQVLFLLCIEHESLLLFFENLQIVQKTCNSPSLSGHKGVQEHCGVDHGWGQVAPGDSGAWKAEFCFSPQACL